MIRTNKINKWSLLICIIIIAKMTHGQNPLFIPDTLNGTIFNLNVQTGTQQFISPYNTPTYGYNGNILGPTLLFNAGDTVTLNVTNGLTQATTVHWHGLHVAPENDGGPHQIIAANGGIWSPTFEVKNEAGTFWYHPHGENKTELQVTRGLAGMIIIRDTIEDNYALPRTYSVDDFPLIIQSKAFDVLYQFATANHEDSVVLVNATIDSYLEVPQQVVRFRLLNGSSDRTYFLGLEDNSDFHIIASDGGLLSAPFQTNRVRISPGERVEILVDFSGYSIGNQLYLKSYSSELPYGIIGADSVGTFAMPMGEGYYSNPLNGADFNIVRFDIVAPTASPVLSIPATFLPKVPIPEANTDVYRTLIFDADTIIGGGDQAYVDGPFVINDEYFDMDSINIITYLNNIEVWELINKTMVAHPFHIHDIQFFVVDINGNPPPPQYQGLKDVILVEPGDTVRFITQFITFSDFFVPYMYHCHLLHHEDEGMMGSFLVLDSAALQVDEFDSTQTGLLLFPNPASSSVMIQFADNSEIKHLRVFDAGGRLIYDELISDYLTEINTSNWTPGIYFVELMANNRTSRSKLIIH